MSVVLGEIGRETKAVGIAMKRGQALNVKFSASSAGGVFGEHHGGMTSAAVRTIRRKVSDGKYPIVNL